MKRTLASLALFASAIAPAGAAQFDVEIINLTRGSYFTPFLVAAHAANASLFTTGEPASASIQAMAEGGDIAPLIADVEALNATVVANPASGLLAPGQRTSAALNTDDAPDNTRLSIVAMILPSNDGFMGLNAIEIPSEPGRYVFSVNAYDSGTEANDEIVGSGAPGEPGYPAPPPVLAASGSGGTGIAAMAEGFVHIHRNVLGDDNLSGGNSDIDNTVHRWLNPVVRVVITVN
ncbi:spondin domain-containing protein [Congregibacter variabilis]|uniref:Spondin domain-containing protein n=1 Tax=Congregibacter variabilis TaxID=3081200 RepID=A0ABZ0I6W8_9GAMM|nr:spondin domain-containing protein [Congregibacter sp. IMCC43200]